MRSATRRDGGTRSVVAASAECWKAHLGALRVRLQRQQASESALSSPAPRADGAWWAACCRSSCAAGGSNACPRGGDEAGPRWRRATAPAPSRHLRREAALCPRRPSLASQTYRCGAAVGWPARWRRARARRYHEAAQCLPACQCATIALCLRSGTDSRCCRRRSRPHCWCLSTAPLRPCVPPRRPFGGRRRRRRASRPCQTSFQTLPCPTSHSLARHSTY